MVVFLLLLSACSDSGILLPNVESEDEAVIQTIAAGTILQPGDEMPLAVFMADGSRATVQDVSWLDVRLYSADGSLAADLRILAEDLADLDEIVIPEGIAAGYYDLSAGLYRQDELIVELNEALFITPDVFGLSGISIYPSQFEPNSQGILQAGIRIPAGSSIDPFIVWRFDGAVAAYGLLSEGYDEVRLDSPSVNGVYSLRVDVYPIAPSDGRPYDFPSRRAQSAEIVVSDEIPARPYELQNPSSYFSLLRLNGSVRDIGARMDLQQSPASFRTEGIQPELEIVDGRLGYSLTGGTIFYVGSPVVPFRHGGLAPFTVTFRGRFAAPEDESVHEEFLYSQAQEDFLDISAQDGLLTAKLKYSGVEYAFPVSRSVLPDGEYVRLSFSLLEENGWVYGMWQVNGILISVSSWEIEDFSEGDVAGPVSSRSEYIRMLGLSRIGKGISGMLEEFGVFFRNPAGEAGINAYEFNRMMELQYGGQLIYAKSFLTQPEDVRLSGPAVVSGGYMQLSPGAEVRLPMALFSGTDIIFELSLADSDEGSASASVMLEDEDGARSLPIDLAESTSLQAGVESGRLVLRQGRRDLGAAGAGAALVIQNDSRSRAVLNLKHVLARHVSGGNSGNLWVGAD